ncbi:hypothetical protein [Streptomyces sp. NPDC048438]|uniref:hypothetical protein n=1 Tax=Streptomyces sp. NPDC048438 TaxID=3365551 RepID=UPI003722C5B2
MTGVDLIVAALAAGTSAGLTDAASGAVGNAYGCLLDAVRRRLGGGAGGETEASNVLAAGEVESEVWEARLRRALAQADAENDGELVSAARTLLEELRSTVPPKGTYVVDASHAQGAQVGDGNSQTNTFHNSVPAHPTDGGPPGGRR